MLHLVPFKISLGSAILWGKRGGLSWFTRSFPVLIPVILWSHCHNNISLWLTRFIDSHVWRSFHFPEMFFHTRTHARTRAGPAPKLHFVSHVQVQSSLESHVISSRRITCIRRPYAIPPPKIQSGGVAGLSWCSVDLYLPYQHILAILIYPGKMRLTCNQQGHSQLHFEGFLCQQ